MFPDTEMIEGKFIFFFFFTKFLLLFSGILASVWLRKTLLVNSKFFFKSICISLLFNYHPGFPKQICFINSEVNIHFFMAPVSGYLIPYTKKNNT